MEKQLNDELQQNRRILFLDDESDVLVTLLGITEDEGVQADGIEDIDTLDEKLKSGNYTEVWCDGLDGEWEEALKIVKSHNIGFILFSGNYSYVHKAKEMGLDAYLKDFNKFLVAIMIAR